MEFKSCDFVTSLLEQAYEAVGKRTALIITPPSPSLKGNEIVAATSFDIHLAQIRCTRGYLLDYHVN